MSTKLFVEAISKYLLGVILIGLLIFLPANTLNYWNGWLFMGLLFIPMFIAGIVMMLKSPDLLRKRLNIKEKENEQKLVIKLSGLMFLLSFIIAGLNFRFKWFIMPNWIIIISSIIFIISYIIYAEVLKENAFLSRTIEVDNNQKVIDTGIYKIVRHPMYTATIFLFLSMPLILGSLISFIIMLAYPFIIIKRLNNEEQVLLKDLKGYKEYQEKVKYKLIPFIW
ncbi:MAG: isoprenylcysteine carboxylmethyltransferase family protein [Firmicutes bacterium]|nr:isoprenylcysteine carboxylmethyltransferase family protein [Bacillota bacterium]